MPGGSAGDHCRAEARATRSPPVRRTISLAVEQTTSAPARPPGTNLLPAKPAVTATELAAIRTVIRPAATTDPAWAATATASMVLKVTPTMVITQMAILAIKARRTVTRATASRTLNGTCVTRGARLWTMLRDGTQSPFASGTIRYRPPFRARTFWGRYLRAECSEMRTV